MTVSQNNLLSVLIIGCGNIAGGFDENKVADENPLTHAGAFSLDGRFSIRACVDPDPFRVESFKKFWSIPVGFLDLEDVLVSRERYDIISICSPTKFHVSEIGLLMQLKPKLIFCEKPIAPTVREAKLLLEACNEAGVLLVINYTRRWDDSITKIKSRILNKEMGDLRSIIGLYNKGILNNGSHMLDLLHDIFESLEVIKVGRPVHDYISEDPTIPVWLETGSGIPIFIAPANAGDYSVFELQFIFSLGVLAMESGGALWRERNVVKSGDYIGYSKLSDGRIFAGNYSKAMLAAVDNIYRAIIFGDALMSTGETALYSQKMCEMIKKNALPIKTSQAGKA